MRNQDHESCLLTCPFIIWWNLYIKWTSPEKQYLSLNSWYPQLLLLFSCYLSDRSWFILGISECFSFSESNFVANNLHSSNIWSSETCNIHIYASGMTKNRTGKKKHRHSSDLSSKTFLFIFYYWRNSQPTSPSKVLLNIFAILPKAILFKCLFM